jgi:hypothetical protein
MEFSSMLTPVEKMCVRFHSRPSVLAEFIRNSVYGASAADAV